MAIYDIDVNVCFGSEADISQSLADVRFTPHKRTLVERAKSGLCHLIRSLGRQ
jgi:hypothetical protein